MSYQTAAFFCQKHGGFRGLQRFIELCNTPGMPDWQIAQFFNVSRSQVSRWRKSLLVQQWIPDRGTYEYLNFLDKASEWESDDRARLMDAATRKSLGLIVNGQRIK